MSQLSQKLTLQALKSFIDSEIKAGRKPLGALQTYRMKLDRYKKEFGKENDEKVDSILKSFQ